MKNSDSKKTVYFMAYSAAIAAIYTVLTMIFAAISFGPVQFRISEALTILPYFTGSAVPGLTLGCFLSNLLCGAPAPDIVFGTLATFIGAAGSWALRRYKHLVCMPPILSNAIIVPWVLRFAYGSEELIWVMMITVGIGEILSVGILGNGLLMILERYRNTIFEKV